MSLPIDNKLIERINDLIFTEVNSEHKVEILQELFTIRNALYGNNLEKKLSGDKRKPLNSILSKIGSFAKKYSARKSFQRYLSQDAFSQEKTPAPHKDNYSDEEKRKTREALERIYKNNLLSKEEAERIFNKIYNSHYNKT